MAATVIGNTIEFYDFSVYGTLTAVVFGRLFFATDDPFLTSFLAFGTFAVGFLSRPIGGMIFGHLGDKYGRKPVLVASLLTMGIATTLMGALPTLAQAGIVAPILLVVLRFIQGFGIGGEWGGATTLMMESTPAKRRGFFGAAVQTGSGMGIILATGLVTLMFVVLTPEQIDAWGWRIPLLFSIVLVVIGLIVRSHIEESPDFEQREASATIAKTPLLEALARHWKMVLVAIGMYIAVAAFGFTQGVFFINYLINGADFPQYLATIANLVAAVTYLFATLIGGVLSDRFGRSVVYLVGGVLLIPASFIMFGSGMTGSVPIVMIAMAIVGLFSGIAYGAQASLFFELFPARVRYTGVSLGFQIAAVLGGGLSPLIASSLVEATGSVMSVAIYISALSLLLVVCTLVAPRVLEAEKKRSGELDRERTNEGKA
ncbi:MFS transporter [Microbacterium sp. MPKO10]|uniref:MFS transporter n=1 Tax=Microbacterium sp. MPKO10 TaxID=2989818 RepID=UPI002236B4B9|nr:MFS transporter [Microbacterium sp. MPKO10]MCW4457521.1 MFS transporter [Microbacterium sp. MPKO10]